MPSKTHGTVISMLPRRMSKSFSRITVVWNSDSDSGCTQTDAGLPGVVRPLFRKMIVPRRFVMFCGAFEVSLSRKRKEKEGWAGQFSIVLPGRHAPTEDDAPGHILSRLDGPHRTGGGGQDRRRVHILSGARRDRYPEDGLQAEREEREDWGKLSEHGCCR